MTQSDKEGGSQYKGVALLKKRKTPKWVARLTVRKKTYSSTVYETELEAAAAYNSLVLMHVNELMNLGPDGEPLRLAEVRAVQPEVEKKSRTRQPLAKSTREMINAERSRYNLPPLRGDEYET